MFCPKYRQLLLTENWVEEVKDAVVSRQWKQRRSWFDIHGKTITENRARESWSCYKGIFSCAISPAGTHAKTRKEGRKEGGKASQTRRIISRGALNPCVGELFSFKRLFEGARVQVRDVFIFLLNLNHSKNEEILRDLGRSSTKIFIHAKQEN